MKKILILIALFLIYLQNTFATEIIVKIPINLNSVISTCSSGSTTDGVYECKIEAGFGSIEKGIGQIIKYFTFITGLAGVLFIIYNGIKLSMAGINSEYEKEAKDNIKKTLLGLILLLLSGVILNFIAPWVYT